MWEAIFWVFVGANVGAMGMGWVASNKCHDLQTQVDAKRQSWCGECRHKLDAAAFDELLAHERRSKYACLREKEKEIQGLKVKLYNATRDQGEDFFNRIVARG